MNDLTALSPTLSVDFARVPGTQEPRNVSAMRGGARTFSSTLHEEVDQMQRREKAREAAAKFIGLAFIQPILTELRESTQAKGMFAPTEGERRFGPMIDASMTDRISSAMNFPLVDSIADRLMRVTTSPGGESNG